MKSEVWRCGPPRNTGRKQGFPDRFWTYFTREYAPWWDTRGESVYPLKEEILHLCSGAHIAGLNETTIDIDPDAPAMYHEDATNLQNWADEGFEVVFADPPYFTGYAKEWPADLPRPAHLLREMYRVCRVGGIIALLHILVVPAPRGLGPKLEREAIHAILAGPHNAMRALNVFRKVE